MSRIIEIDGPPVAYFEFLKRRIEYKTLAIGGNDPNVLVQYGENQLEMIRSELGKLEEPILYWRRRPVLLQIVDSDLFKWTCRLQVYPELPESFWSKLCVKKLGEEPGVLKYEPDNE